MKLSVKLIALSFILSISSCGADSSLPEGSGSESQAATVSKNVDVQEFKELIKSPGVILDVRTSGECQNGMIEGAINIDYMGSNFAAGIEELDKNTPVYIYCASGGRSGRAMGEMASLGFTHVYNLVGGYNAWK